MCLSSWDNLQIFDWFRAPSVSKPTKDLNAYVFSVFAILNDWLVYHRAWTFVGGSDKPSKVNIYYCQ